MKTPQIPETHRDLIDRPLWAALTTVMPDGQPQTTPVWCNRSGDTILINCMKGFRKTRNMRANPKVSLFVYDPNDPLRNIEIRGMVTEMCEKGALEHLDVLTQLYMNKPTAHFFGDSVAIDFQEIHIPLKIAIRPTHIRVEE